VATGAYGAATGAAYGWATIGAATGAFCYYVASYLMP